MRKLSQYAKTANRIPPRRARILLASVENCRLLAEAHSQWKSRKILKAINRPTNKLLKKLSNLRDQHVQLTWVKVIGTKDDPLACQVRSRLLRQEAIAAAHAKEALKNFDWRHWHHLIQTLNHDKGLFRLSSSQIRHFVVNRCQQAFLLHKQVLRIESPDLVMFHRLYLAFSNFRYTVANFIPSLYRLWKKDLEKLQSLFEDYYNLERLCLILGKSRGRCGNSKIESWLARIRAEQKRRLEGCHSFIQGNPAIWKSWLQELERL